jgi:putative membrane protein
MSTIGSWTFGSGTVIWKIWPAILLHTAVAALVTTLSLTNVLGFSLAIPNIMMTVLGSSFSVPYFPRF